MKDNNNMMMWAFAAAAAWFLWKQGTLDPYIGGFSDMFPGDEVVVNGNGNGNGDLLNGNGNGSNGSILIDEGGEFLGEPPAGWAIVDGVMVQVNGVSGIADWGDIYS